MKCIPGKTTRAFCLKCNAHAQVINFVTPMLYMECQCGETWRTISAICEHCKQPSGSPYLTDCAHCSSKQKQKEETAC